MIQKPGDLLTGVRALRVVGRRGRGDYFWRALQTVRIGRDFDRSLRRGSVSAVHTGLPPDCAGDGAKRSVMRSFSLVSALVSLALLSACTDEGEGDNSDGGSPPSTGGSPPSDGGSGAMSNDGGGGAGGGSGGEGGSGGAAPLQCLADSVASEFFTINGDDLCIVQTFEAAGLELPSYGTTPTWGAHGGPLTFAPNGANTSLTLTRWSKSGTTLTAADTNVALTGVPAGAFFGSIAVESDATGAACADEHVVSVGWSGTPFDSQGAIVTITPGDDAVSTTATGVFGMASVGSSVFYTGLSEVAGPTNGVVGLYAAATEACDAGLVTGGAVETGWGLATGPAAADLDGNLFAILTDYLTGRQLIHGYRAEDLAGGGALVGTELADLEGYGDAFAAVVPAGAEPGLLVLQPNAGKAGLNQDVVAVEYSSAGGTLSPGLTKTLLTLAEADKNITLMTDDDGNLWVGVSIAGDTPSTTFFVMARPPAD